MQKLHVIEAVAEGPRDGHPPAAVVVNDRLVAIVDAGDSPAGVKVVQVVTSLIDRGVLSGRPVDAAQQIESLARRHQVPLSAAVYHRGSHTLWCTGAVRWRTNARDGQETGDDIGYGACVHQLDDADTELVVASGAYACLGADEQSSRQFLDGHGGRAWARLVAVGS